MSHTPTPGGLGPAFWARRPLVGMVHLGALPGSVRDAGHFDAVLEQAIADARNLLAGGADAVMVENFFDAPFAKSQVPPSTIAALARAVLAVREVAGDVPVGVNCLRNDGVAAMGIAHACGARFIRVNVYVGAAVTDQGVIEGIARDVQRTRRELGADVAVWADVHVKHARPLGDGRESIEDAARDAVHRGLADALVVSGAATGAGTPVESVHAVARAVPGIPVLVGSGCDVETAGALLAAGAAGAIVGTSIKRDRRVDAPVDPGAVRALRAAFGYQETR